VAVRSRKGVLGGGQKSLPACVDTNLTNQSGCFPASTDVDGICGDCANAASETVAPSRSMRSAGINLFMGFSRVACRLSKEKIEKLLVSLGPFRVRSRP